MVMNEHGFYKNNLDVYFATRRAPGQWLPRSTTVAYTRYFLRCIGTPPTDPMWHRRGTIVDVKNDRLVYVLWHDWAPGDTRELIALANLANVGANTRFSD